MELIEPTLNERSMMFREMRRKRQLLPPEESLAILERMTPAVRLPFMATTDIRMPSP